MSPLASLQSRIFLASALLPVASIVVAIYLVGSRVNFEAEHASTARHRRDRRARRRAAHHARRELHHDGAPYRRCPEAESGRGHRRSADGAGRLGRLPGTVALAPPARDQPRRPAAGERRPAAQPDSSTRRSSRRFEKRWTDVRASRFSRHPRACCRSRPCRSRSASSIPTSSARISVGFLLDDALANQLKAVTGSDIAFGMDGVVLAGTLAREEWPSLGKLLQASQPQTVTLAGEDFSVLARPLSAEAAVRRPLGAQSAGAPLTDRPDTIPA